MKEWILILNLLGQDHVTNEIDWHEAARVDNITLQTCVEELVTLVVMFEENGIQHDVYCTTKERGEREPGQKQ